MWHVSEQFPATTTQSIDIKALTKEEWTYRISSLDEDRPRPAKLAHQAFTRGEAGYDTTRCHPLHHVLAVPGDQVSVVDDVLFAFSEL